MFHENVRLSQLHIAELQRSAKSFNAVEADCRRTTNAALVSTRALLAHISLLEETAWPFKTKDSEELPAYGARKLLP